MATIYGAETSSWYKGYITYSTSYTNTSYTITVNEAGAYCTANSKATAGQWDVTLSCTGKSSIRKPSSGTTYYSVSPKTKKDMTGTQTFTYTKGKTAQDVYVSAAVHFAHGGNTSTATSDKITIPAKPSYTVSYNANGGSGAPASQTKWYGETLYLSSTLPTRTGYNFKGWAWSSSPNTVSFQPGAAYIADSGATLMAVWENAGPYTITYNPKGGISGEITSQIKTFGNPIIIPQAAEPSREGYTFQGWSTSSFAVTATYHTGDSYTTESSATLYAVWKEQNITITFNANTADTVQDMPSDMTMKYWTTDSKTISTISPSRLNYAFKGWTLTQDGSGTVYQPGDTFYNPRPQTLVTLYAQWDTAIINYYYWDNITTPHTQYAVPGSTGALWSCGEQTVEVPDITINSVVYEFAKMWLKISSTAAARLTNSSFYHTDNPRESYVGGQTLYRNIQGTNHYKALYKRKFPLPATTQPYMFFIRTNGVFPPEFIAKTEEQFAQLEDIAGNHISGYIRFNSPYPQGTVISCFPNQPQPSITKRVDGLLVRDRDNYTSTSTISYSISPGYWDKQQHTHALTGTVSAPIIKGNYVYLYINAGVSSDYRLDEGTQVITISWDNDSTIVTNDFGVEISLAEYIYNLIGVNFIVDINATGTMLSLGGEAIDLDNQNKWPSTVQNYTQNEHPEQGTSTSTPKLGEPLSITAVQNPFYVLNTDDEFIPAITEGVLEDEIVLKSEVAQAWATLLSGGTPSSVTAVPLSVTQNGLYTAPAGYAYTPVTVNVESGPVSHYSNGILILS